MWLLFCISLAIGSSNTTYSAYTQWKLDYDIRHSNTSEETYRYGIWKRRVGEIGLNPYTDRTVQEVDAFFKRSAELMAAPPHGGKYQNKWGNFAPNEVAAALRTYRDWPKSGYVTDPKNMGSQPYSGAFSRVSTAESTYGYGGGYRMAHTPHYPPPSFSVEQVIDCDGYDQIQDKSFFETGFNSWGAYPYDSSAHDPDKPQACKFNPDIAIPGTNFGAWAQDTCPSKNKTYCEEQLAAYVYFNGPVQVGFNSKIFLQANTGHYVDADACNSIPHKHKVDMGVALVGYGPVPYNPDAKKYWIIKNSWGTNWQDGGYIRVAFGVNCGGMIGTAMTYFLGGSANYFPDVGGIQLPGHGKCGPDAYKVADTYDTIQNAVNAALEYPMCTIFFTSARFAAQGVWCANDLKCVRDGNSFWNAYQLVRD